MFGVGTTELLIIGGIITLLFGAKKIPEMAKGIGRGIKEFKREMSDSGEAEKKNISNDTYPSIEKKD